MTLKPPQGCKSLGSAYFLFLGYLNEAKQKQANYKKSTYMRLKKVKLQRSDLRVADLF